MDYTSVWFQFNHNIEDRWRHFYKPHKKLAEMRIQNDICKRKNVSLPFTVLDHINEPKGRATLGEITIEAQRRYADLLREDVL